jgi:hypothetical protein
MQCRDLGNTGSLILPERQLRNMYRTAAIIMNGPLRTLSESGFSGYIGFTGFGSGAEEVMNPVSAILSAAKNLLL